MKRPTFEDFYNGFQSFKLLTAGCETRFGFLYPAGNFAAHAKFDKYKLDLLPQMEIVALLKEMIPFIAIYEGYSEALRFDHLNGDNVLLAQEIEKKRAEFITNIFVTGFTISGDEDKRSIQISYKKIAKDGKINGHATQGIKISGNSFGFEEDLEKTIENLITEIYAYVYEDKYSDSDQSELSIWQSGHEVIGEEPEIHEETERTGETPIKEVIKKVKKVASKSKK